MTQQKGMKGITKEKKGDRIDKMWLRPTKYIFEAATLGIGGGCIPMRIMESHRIRMGGS